MFEVLIGFGLDQVDEVNSGTTIHVYSVTYRANTMPADTLATSGARVSVHMVLIPKAGIFRLQH